MRTLLALLIVLTSATLVVAQEDGKAARKRHQWGRFTVGAWKRMRIRKETYSEGKVAVTSVEEAQTTLTKADDLKFTLELVTHVKAAGEDLNRPKREVSLTYYGASPGQKAEVKTLDAQATVEIEGRKVPCQVMEVKVISKSMHRTTKLFIGKNTLMPLRQETTVTPEDNILVQTTSHVTLQNILHLVMNEPRNATMIRTEVRRPDSIQHTVEVHCAQVPGGVVHGWTKVTDRNGVLKERVLIELVDFGIPSE